MTPTDDHPPATSPPTLFPVSAAGRRQRIPRTVRTAAPGPRAQAGRGIPMELHACNPESTLRRVPTFLDLFSGAGGLSVGLEDAGWVGLAGIDHWSDAVDTYNANLSHPGHCVDIRELRPKDLARLCSDRPDWIVGGPPCQGYSTVGRRDPTDMRNKLFLEFRRIVKALKPEGFLIENVLGLKDMSFEAEVKREFESLGYAVEFLVLTAAEHGVPQLRRRVVFVGHRDGARFIGPSRTHVPEDYVTVLDAIGDLPRLAPGESATRYTSDPFTPYQKALRDGCHVLTSHVAAKHPRHLIEAISHIPDGGNRRDIPPHLQPSSGFHNSYSRLASWLPAVAVTQNMSKPSATRCIHPFQHRGLTSREGARLQSFPDRFTFLHGQVSQRLQIANAVPPVLGRALGEALIDPHRWW